MLEETAQELGFIHAGQDVAGPVVPGLGQDGDVALGGWQEASGGDGGAVAVSAQVVEGAQRAATAALNKHAPRSSGSPIEPRGEIVARRPDPPQSLQQLGPEDFCEGADVEKVSPIGGQRLPMALRGDAPAADPEVQVRMELELAAPGV